MSNIEPREEVVDGVWVYTYDPDDNDFWKEVDERVREEQDNDYIAEQMAEQYDNMDE